MITQDKMSSVDVSANTPNLYHKKDMKARVKAFISTANQELYEAEPVPGTHPPLPLHNS